MSMRFLFAVALSAVFVLAGCDAVAPSSSADTSSSYTMSGPSTVIAGSCDTFQIVDTNGTPQLAYNWAVSGSGYLTGSGTSSALVLATARGFYRVSANAGSPSGTTVSKFVRVFSNPDNTSEC